MGKGLEIRGVRKVACKRCQKHLCRDDIGASGICKWCEFDEQEAQAKPPIEIR